MAAGEIGLCPEESHLIRRQRKGKKANPLEVNAVVSVGISAIFCFFAAQSFVDMLNKARDEGMTIINKYEKILEEQKLSGSVTMEMGRPGEVLISK